MCVWRYVGVCLGAAAIGVAVHLAVKNDFLAVCTTGHHHRQRNATSDSIVSFILGHDYALMYTGE